jgi:N6-L-threonylcarbamoyladenine synthase
VKILAIETSCDETSVALVEARGGLKKPQFKILKNIVASQIKVHRPFGGVVPNLAKREHVKNLPKIFHRIMNQELRIKNMKPVIHNSSFIIPGIDAVAVTVGPGLEPALWAGIEFAKKLYADLCRSKRGSTRKIELIGVNHMEGHLYSNWLPRKKSRYSSLISHLSFPAIALVVSGGHTILLKMDSLTKWKKLGETRDDAAGEAFDKTARLLELPYPGGPELEKLAKAGNPQVINFPRPMLKDKSYDFSFSGLKTAVLYYLRDHFPRESASNPGRSAFIADVAASFQQAVIDVLIEKTIRAAKEFKAKSVLLCGGVAANRALRQQLQHLTSNSQLKFHVPDLEYNTDNAAMIAVAAYIQKLKNKKLRLIAQPNLNL